jgi:hypothetical protein
METTQAAAKQKNRRTAGVVLLAAGVVGCLGSICCGSLAPILGQDAGEPVPALIALFAGAIVISLASLAALIGGVALVVLSARGAGPGPEGLVCLACGEENPPDHAFCDRCGEKLYEEIV